MPTYKQQFKTKMNALADSINAKAESTGKKDLDELKTAVDGIQVGVDTSDATATAGDILSGKSAYGSAGTKLDGAIPSQAAQTITPTTSDQTIAAGKYLAGAQTIKGDANLVAGKIKKDVTIFGVTGSYEGETPTGNQDIETLNEYNVASKATARVSATERAKIIPENIKKDITILGVTGTHEGGGSGTKPAYLLNDGDTVSTFYFNTEYNLATVLSQMTYGTDPQTGYRICWLEFGDFYAVDLTGGNYALVWNDGLSITPIYSTTPVPTFGVTTAGWQVSSFTPSAAVTITLAEIEEHFAAAIDNIVADSVIAFGTKKATLSVSDNGTYNAPSGTLYNSVSVSVSGGGTQPTLNAPTISFTSGTMNLKITDPSTNGNFTTGFKIFVDGVETYTTSRTGTNTTYDMSSVSANTATITVKAYGSNFQDSAASNSATFYKYFTVNMYDDDATTFLKTQSVAYGSMPTYTPTKIGYSFEHWEDSNGNTVTAITGDTNLYATYTVGYYIAAGTYSVRVPYPAENKYTNVDITLPFTWKRKVGSAGSTMTGNVLYYKTYYSTPTIWCSKTTTDLSNRLMTWGSTTGWNPSSFIFEEDGNFPIVVTADTNCTQAQKEQFDYFFVAIQS